MPRRTVGARMLLLTLAVALVACSSPPIDNGGAAATATYDAEDAAADWRDSSATVVEFRGDTAQVNGAGVSVQGSDVYIVSAGVYVLRGQLTSGQVLVDAQTKGTVRIVLDGVELHNDHSAAIYVRQADETIITLAEGTENVVSDGPDYVDTTSEDAPKAAIYSMDDLVINGGGRLTVQGNFDVGIQSKDDLRILGGELFVTAVDDGVIGRDLLYITGAAVTVESGGDALKATNDKDPAKGRVVIEGGTFRLTAGSDGIQAETTLQISGGDFSITTNGGHTNGAVKTGSFGPMGGRTGFGGFGRPRMRAPSETGTAPGTGAAPEWSGTPGTRMPPGMGTPPEMGTPPMGIPPEMGTPPGTGMPSGGGGQPADSGSTDSGSSSAKGLKAGREIVISGGRFQIDSADDAVHSDGAIRISAGEFTILSGDDGIHADDSLVIEGGKIAIQQSYEGLESQKIILAGGTVDIVASDDGINVAGGADGSSMGGRPGQNAFWEDNGTLTIEGGEISVDAAGDGLDANGSIFMSGGTVRVNGPTTNMNGALDYNNRFEISGGTLVAAGSTGMAQAPSEQSPQHSVSMVFTSPPAAGTKVSLRDAQGNELVGMALKQAYPSVVLSAPGLRQGETYAIYAGEEKVVSFTLENPVTWVNESGVTTPRQGFSPGWRR